VRVHGRLAVNPAPEPMTEDTVFDVASLTKVIATTPVVMVLVEQRLLELDQPVARYWPEFGGEGKEQITLRHLLTHTSGLRAGLSGRPEWSGAAAALA